MLVALSIRDIVLIEKLDLEWRAGLCALTGETGAGKSILLDALALATGARGDANLVAHGAERGSVTAAFDIASNGEAARLLNENDIEREDQLVLRRVQTKDGRTRAFVNDRPVSIGLLKQLGAALVEIHGQNESQSLTEAETQRNLLDAFAGHQDDVAALGENYQAMQAALARLETYRHARAEAAGQADYLRHAVAELTRLAPQKGEEAALAQERTMLMNAEKITQDLNEALALLSDGGGFDAALNGALRRLEKAAPQAAGRLNEAVVALERTVLESDEARRALSEATGEVVFDPEKLQKLDERLFALKDAARKHNVAVDELCRVQEQLAAQIDDIDKGADSEAELEAAWQMQAENYRQNALAISARRKAAAEKLDAAIASELPHLKLDGGQFTTLIESCDAAQGGAHGVDKVQFMAATNPGTPPAPIAKIASGGELARFMLALKVALAGAGEPRTMIFDEVDTGVGGAVAEAVGERLKRLAHYQHGSGEREGQGQVLVVTHSPQVAACGDHQWQIVKRTAQADMKTQVKELTRPDREEEIARMLAGATITDEARAAAHRLLEA